MNDKENKGIENLIPFDKLTEEQQREIRSKGGKASQEVKKKKKDFNEAIKTLLSLEFKGEEAEEIKKKHNLDNLDIFDAMTLKVAERAIKRGDAYSFQQLADRVIGKPTQGVDLTSKGKKLNTPQVLLYLPDDGRLEDAKRNGAKLNADNSTTSEG